MGRDTAPLPAGREPKEKGGDTDRYWTKWNYPIIDTALPPKKTFWTEILRKVTRSVKYEQHV